MRNLLLSFLFLGLALKAQSQFSCPCSSTIKTQFYDDAVLNAVRQSYIHNTTWIDSLKVDTNLAKKFLGAICGAWYSFSNPNWNPVFGTDPIHDFETHALHVMEINIDSNQTWAKQLYYNKDFSGHPRLDSINKQFSFSILDTHYGRTEPYFDLSIRSETPFNFTKLSQLIKSLPGVRSAHGWGCVGCNEEVWAFYENANIHLYFDWGYGDCPPGCMYWKTYEYLISPTCGVLYSNEKDKKMTDLQDQEEPGSARIFPNPSSGIVYLENIRAKQFTVFDLSGRQLIKGSLKGNEIDFSPLPNGQYLLECELNNGETHRQSLMIIK